MTHKVGSIVRWMKVAWWLLLIGEVAVIALFTVLALAALDGAL